MIEAVIAIVAAYAIGSIPIAYLTGRATKGIDLRDHGSGNPGASNVWQSVSKSLVVPVGLAQIAQGLAAVLLAIGLDVSEAVCVACALAALIANNWNPWLGFTGGRGVGVVIGALLALSPVALVVFIAVALVGVALREIPQGVGAALIIMPFGAVIADQSPVIVLGCALLAAVVLLKRLNANGAPDAAHDRPAVWLHRLLYDRDVRDREAWVRRKAVNEMRDAGHENLGE